MSGDRRWPFSLNGGRLLKNNCDQWNEPETGAGRRSRDAGHPRSRSLAALFLMQPIYRTRRCPRRKPRKASDANWTLQISALNNYRPSVFELFARMPPPTRPPWRIPRALSFSSSRPDDALFSFPVCFESRLGISSRPV